MIYQYFIQSLCVLTEAFKKETMLKRYAFPESQIVKVLRKNLVTEMSPQRMILLKSSPKIYHIFPEYRNFQKNIGPVEDSMNVAKNNVAEVNNNHLKDCRFSDKMSPDEIVGK